MSRLFTVARSIDEIVVYFGIDVATSMEVPSETVEGAHGLVVIEKDRLKTSWQRRNRSGGGVAG